ncbi:MAG: hypothetical protein OCC49_16660 [Fibrobacterales bacterium]
MKYLILLIALYCGIGFAQYHPPAPDPFIHHHTPGGSWSLKNYKPCKGTSCGSERWVGMFGEKLLEDMEPYPEAHKMAQSFQAAAITQSIAFIAVPVFLFTGVSAANAGTMGEDGSHDPDKPFPTSAKVLLGMCGASFITIIVTNIIEKNILENIQNNTGRITITGSSNFYQKAFGAQLALSF